ncbi:uncharacterized protein LOC108915668 [Anoplophora glabripennis]|uniref:uncharacterized protein LOC108915668 n=1 Tax=Anoplophora glabripennis TaxID=217634 RepID=UPI0008747F5F|nr:uncharacterized protein LOC108915668 [Anoplophora glabripennis]
MAVRLDNLKNHSMKIKIEQLEEENRQLLSMLHPRLDELGTSRTPSNSSCSTTSIVHLQYKYEELLANHNGLLKILELRISDVRRYQEENAKLKQEVENLKASLESHNDQISKLLEKNKELKYRKNNKILRLKNDRNTLAIIHNRLVNLLHKQCMENDNFLHKAVKETSKSERALLLQEIRNSNILSYENFQLQQENEYLQSVLNVKKRSSFDLYFIVIKLVKYDLNCTT